MWGRATREIGRPPQLPTHEASASSAFLTTLKAEAIEEVLSSAPRFSNRSTQIRSISGNVPRQPDPGGHSSENMLL